MRQKLFLLVFWGIIIVFLLLGACNKPSAKLTEISVGYMPIAECGPLFLGVDKGIFEKHGLKLDLKRFPGGSIILESIVGGGLDIGFSNLVSPILARTEGIDIVAFAGGTYEDNSHQLHAVVVKPDSGISKCSDLKGKTIAVNTKRNIDHLLLNSWLRSNGVFPESVSLSEIPFPRMETVLQGGGVDAIAVVEPFLTHAKDVGFIAIGNYFLSGNVGRIDVTSYCAKSSWLEKNNKVAKAFKDALNEAIEYSNKHEKEVRDTIAKWTRLDTKLTDKIGVPGFSFFPSENGVNYLIKKLNEEKFITKKITAKELLKN